MEINEATALRWVKKALLSIRIMEAKRSERKPAGAGLPSSVRKMRGINVDAPQVKTVSFDRDVDLLGSSARKEASVHAGSGRRWWSGRAAGGRTSRLDAGTMATSLRLLRRLPKAAKHRSDRYEAYSIPPLILRIKEKGSEANRNEVLHSKLRVKLNRLVRRTHGCGKRLYMLVRSLAMARLRDGLYQR